MRSTDLADDGISGRRRRGLGVWGLTYGEDAEGAQRR